MKRVTGLGGVFFKSEGKSELLAWYREHLGIAGGDYGFQFLWQQRGAPDKTGYTVWSPFARDTSYFEPSDKPFMINYRVDDLVALVAALEQEGVAIVGGIDEEENGKFAWILDPEGNKIELWEPIDPDSDPYLPQD